MMGGHVLKKIEQNPVLFSMYDVEKLRDNYKLLYELNKKKDKLINECVRVLSELKGVSK